MVLYNIWQRYARLVDCKPGCLIITVECGSLKILEELWQDYCTGNLGRVVQECLVTEDILKELGLSEIKIRQLLKNSKFIIKRTIKRFELLASK